MNGNVVDRCGADRWQDGMTGEGRRAEARKLVNALFENLMRIFPSARHTMLSTPQDVEAMKRQWVVAFMENGITSVEQIKNGLRVARMQENDFWPSCGKFIGWCRKGRGVFGLSTNDVMDEYWRWRKLCFRWPTSEQFPWRHPVLYHICLELRRRGTEGQLTENELVRVADELLRLWETRVLSGKPVPPVRRALTAPSGDYGSTPAELLMAKYRQRKAAGLI